MEYHEQFILYHCTPRVSQIGGFVSNSGLGKNTRPLGGDGGTQVYWWRGCVNEGKLLDAKKVQWSRTQPKKSLLSLHKKGETMKTLTNSFSQKIHHKLFKPQKT